MSNQQTHTHIFTHILTQSQTEQGVEWLEGPWWEPQGPRLQRERVKNKSQGRVERENDICKRVYFCRL